MGKSCPGKGGIESFAVSLERPGKWYELAICDHLRHHYADCAQPLSNVLLIDPGHVAAAGRVFESVFMDALQHNRLLFHSMDHALEGRWRKQCGNTEMHLLVARSARNVRAAGCHLFADMSGSISACGHDV